MRLKKLYIADQTIQKLKLINMDISCEMNQSCEVWELTILDKLQEGYMVITPIGDTAFMTFAEYDDYLKNREQSNLDS